MNMAYVTLLYLDREKKYTYLDGAILVGLGLRRQKTKYKLICMITNDIDEEIVEILNKIYDEIKIVNYISPIKKKDNIIITSEIFSKGDYWDDNIYNNICNVFTKLHIFNSEIFPYRKIVFIDNDIIPIEKYDELFNLECPAGWLENIKDIEKENEYIRTWNDWGDEIKQGDIIDKVLTDIHSVPGRSINSGLLVIEPNKQIFDNMINQLQKPIVEWMGREYDFKGGIDILNKKTLYFPFHDQDYITQFFSGKWIMMDGKYCKWGHFDNKCIYGLHMAGLRYNINGNWENKKTWMMQIPIEDGFNTISNKLVIWGFKNYPFLKNHLHNHLNFYIHGKIIEIENIKNDSGYLFLNKYQKQMILYKYII